MEILGEPDGRPELLVLRALGLGDLLVAVPTLHALRRSRPEHRLILASPAWLDSDRRAGPRTRRPAAHRRTRRPARAAARDGSTPWSTCTAAARRAIASRRPRPQHRIGHRAPGWAGPDWVDDIARTGARWARLVRAYGMVADPDEVAIDRPAEPSPVPRAVVLHVGAFYGAREWPVARFAATAAALASSGHPVVFTGGAARPDRGPSRPRSVGPAAGHGPGRPPRPRRLRRSGRRRRAGGLGRHRRRSPGVGVPDPLGGDLRPGSAASSGDRRRTGRTWC